MLGQDYASQDCALARALEVVGERWSLLVVRDAFYGVRRFSDFQAHLGVPRSVLVDRLAHLVDAGVLARRPDPDRRSSHLYELTGAGTDLWPAIHALLAWGASHVGAGRRRFVHAGCSTPLSATGSCPDCGAVPPAADVVTVPVPGTSPRGDDGVSLALDGPHRLLEPLDVRRRRRAAVG